MRPTPSLDSVTNEIYTENSKPKIRQSRKGSHYGLHTFLIIMFCSLFSHSLPHDTCLNNSLVCKDLNCLRFSKGRLIHFNFYENLNRVNLPVYVCSRRITKCSFYNNFVGQTTRDCTDEYEKLNKETCLEMGRTLHSVDGRLEPVSHHVFFTDNKINEKYSWLRTLTEVKSNSMLQLKLMEHMFFSS